MDYNNNPEDEDRHSRIDIRSGSNLAFGARSQTLNCFERKEFSYAAVATHRRLWIERKKTEQRQRRLREKARSLEQPPSKVLNRVKGHVFAFAGKIAGWPRKKILYPRVERRGGEVAKSIGSAECLVHAEILGGRKTTRKLVKARQMNIPIITEEQFLKLMESKA